MGILLGEGGFVENIRIMGEKGMPEQSEESRNNFPNENMNMCISYMDV